MVQDLSKQYVILDNNIIFDFGSLDDFDLLNKILADSFVLISPDVKEEIKEEISIDRLRFQLGVYIAANDYETHFRLKREHRGLTDADISCVVLAKKHEGLCGSNDRLVRKVAKQEGIVIIGSIGLLECAIAQRILTHKQAVDILLKTIENGAFIEQKLVNNFLRRR